MRPPARPGAGWSFAAAWPSSILQGSDGWFTLTTPGGTRVEARDPFDLLDRTVGDLWRGAAAGRMNGDEGPPFVGGWAGYLGYDLNRYVEKLPHRARPELPVPEIHLAFYETVAALNHRDGTLWLAGILPAGREALVRERARILARSLEEVARRPPAKAPPPAPAGPLVSSFSGPGYLAAIEQALENIRAGEIYQVNLAQRFACRLDPCWGREPGWRVYLRLRERNPAPFACYVQAAGFEIASASPERFLAVYPESGGGWRVQTPPIKGTRPRGKTAQEDRERAADLLRSEKDRAELTMIVDLLRNDLGRVARMGSVVVPELRRLESYPTVHHTVATVEARLRGDATPGSLLRAAFPGGSVTGAPKIRAMEIIDALEPVRRHVYCGCLGFISVNGFLEFNIAIRTLTVASSRALFHAGGGIVADSDPEAEYEETLVKAGALAAALGVPDLGGGSCTSG
nr:aminodeoxychorismate synthase component I [Limnochorda pilosa]